MAGEFAIIDQYFKSGGTDPSDQTVLGIGDDCALLNVPQDMRLAVSKDMLIEHRHFYADVDPQSLGHKTLAVNLSDLAAMGAKPLGCFLGLGLPHINPAWLSGFAKGFLELCARFECPLLGGDTVKTPHDITLSVTILGVIPKATPALVRSAAQVGDDIWVSGQLGAADLAYRIREGMLPHYAHWLPDVLPALNWPTPRVELGQALRGVAHAAIDISDGLLQDLQHVLTASQVGACIAEDQLPAVPVLNHVDPALRRQSLLSGGDVYELCWTAPASQRERLQSMAQTLNVALTRIGHIVDQKGLTVLDSQHRPVDVEQAGFDHFAR